MNPIKKIEIVDMPRRICAGFSTLVSNSKDPSLDDGNIISEVGLPHLIKFDVYTDKPILTYFLRPQKPLRIPGHVFGKMMLGDAYAALVPRIVAQPAVGTSIVLQPTVTQEQNDLISHYKTIRAHCLWIIHVPAPLGVGVFLEVYAPEIDPRTKTRGLKWKPAGVNTIAVMAPWSNDLTVVDRKVGRVGQSGGAIVIRTIEDNTTETVNTPLNITVYQATLGVVCTGKVQSDEMYSIPGLRFIDATPPATSETITLHGDDEGQSTEVNAEGIADLPEQVAPEVTPATVLTPEVEKHVGEPKTLVSSRKTAKPQQGAVGTKWFEAEAIIVGGSDLLTWKNMSIDPAKLGRKGENISLAYKRNVWVTGSNASGYVKTLQIKAVIARSPQISGLIEMVDSRNDSNRYLVEFGGNVEFPLAPAKFTGSALTSRPRYYNNHFLRTDEAQVEWKYRVTGFNRTSDIADVKVRMLVKSGNAVFDVPTKPRPTPPPAFMWLVELMEQKCFEKDMYLLGIEPQAVITLHGDDGDVDDYVTPFAGSEPYMGETNEAGSFDEDLDQDSFAVEVWNGDLPADGNIQTIPLNMALIEDLSGTGGMSTIAQKFERNAHVIPKGEGNLGPSVGHYVIELRLPTSISGQISHVSLPGDMTDEAAVFAFGLGDILSLATTALQAVGGPTVSAGIAAGRAVWSGIKAIGGLISGASKGEAANPPALAGPIDVSRFMEFLKPIAQNELANPTFGNLLVQARDFIGANGNPLESVPARIWAMMQNTGIERSLIDRFVSPSETMVNEVYIPYDRIPYIVDRFGCHKDTFKPGTFQNNCWYKFMSVVRQKIGKTDCLSISIKEVLDYQVTEQDKIVLDSFMESKDFVFSP